MVYRTKRWWCSSSRWNYRRLKPLMDPVPVAMAYLLHQILHHMAKPEKTAVLLFDGTDASGGLKLPTMASIFWMLESQKESKRRSLCCPTAVPTRAHRHRTSCDTITLSWWRVGWREKVQVTGCFFFWQKLKETLVNHGFSRQMLVWTRYFKHAMYRIPANFMLNPFCHSVEKWKIQPGSSTVIYWYLSAMKSNLRARGTHFWVAMFGITHPLNFEAISYLMLTICSYKFIYVPLHKQCFFSILGVHLSTVVNNKHLSTAVNDSLIHNTERQISQNCLIYN